MLHITALHKNYGPLVAIDNVTFSVDPGEIVGLLGPNGAGKTTTLECILGLRHPDAGSITIDGVDLATNRHRALARLGAQLQATTLQDKITPRQALRLFANFYSHPLDSNHLLDRFALTAKADARFETLSAGQRQRLGLALAFINDPLLIVLDEPTAGLDPIARRDLGLLLQQSKSQGRAILFSTHFLEEAQTWCDRVVILHQGKIVASGTPQSLMDAGATQHRFRFRLNAPLPEPLDTAAPIVNRGGGEYDITAATASLALSELARLLADCPSELADLQMIRPSLEDIFLKVTGTPWVDAPNSAHAD